jgi:hypothetical protein
MIIPKDKHLLFHVIPKLVWLMESQGTTAEMRDDAVHDEEEQMMVSYRL